MSTSLSVASEDPLSAMREILLVKPDKMLTQTDLNRFEVIVGLPEPREAVSFAPIFFCEEGSGWECSWMSALREILPTVGYLVGEVVRDRNLLINRTMFGLSRVEMMLGNVLRCDGLVMTREDAAKMVLLFSG